jgi:hypothetical protein
MTEIGIPGDDEDGQVSTTRRLVPMQVGSAVVYVEPFDEGAELQDDGGLRPVGVDPRQAFETASEALKECVRVVGGQLASVGSAITPHTVGMEFTLTFDVEGRASIIPVLLTGKAKSAMGIKVTAEWHPKPPPPGDQ